MTVSRHKGRAAITRFLANLGIATHPGLKINLSQEGYFDYAFGCRAGPSRPNVFDLAHELGHAAQFGARSFNTRASNWGFRFKVPRVFVIDRYCLEPTTCEALVRELHTFAYQLHFMELGGIKVKHSAYTHECAQMLLMFMHDWWHVPGDTEAARLKWCREKLVHFYKGIKPETAKARLLAWLDKSKDLFEAQAHTAPVN